MRLFWLKTPFDLVLQTQRTMILNELKLTLRRLSKEAKYSFINLLGLTLGISFSLLIYTFIINEHSYDLHIPQHEQVYRIAADFVVNGQRDIFSNAPRPLGKTLVEEYPGVLESTKVTDFNGLETHRGY